MEAADGRKEVIIVTEYSGLATWVVYGWALMNRVWETLFVVDSSHAIQWYKDGQWYLDTTNFDLPDLTKKGSDMVDAVMTMAHNGLVFLAQISTLLPANALTPGSP